MNKVLLVGNGFDLAHGLRTKYEHFLEVIKNRSEFNMAASFYLENGKPLVTSRFYYYFKDIKSLNEDNIKKLQEILATNSWVNYFAKCEAEIDGWIDFEREIIPVIQLFDKLFRLECFPKGSNGSGIFGHIKKEHFNFQQLRMINIWNKYAGVCSETICVKAPFVSIEYGILKKQIMKSLRKEFDEFIKAFEIYLLEFVNSVEHKEVLQQIKNIKANYAISCNYTRTEELYGINQDNVHHLHGMIREDIKEDEDGKNTNGEKNNMVVGVNEQKDQNIDFIYFVKYFQRIQKASGTRYKDFVKDEYELYIYGHSLDETDEDILKYIIGDKTEKGDFFYKPRKIFIYYYNQDDYEQKVINLIKLYGRPIVEAYMENGVFEFIPTDATKCAI